MNFDKKEDIKDIGLEMAKYEKVKLKLNNILDTKKGSQFTIFLNFQFTPQK